MGVRSQGRNTWTSLDPLWCQGQWACGAWDLGLMSVDRLECVWHTQATQMEDLWRENWAFQHKWFSERLCRTVWQVWCLSPTSKHSLSYNCTTDIWSYQQLSLKFSGETEGRKVQKKRYVFLLLSVLWLMSGSKSTPTTGLEKEWDCHMYVSTYLYVCVSDCVCVMFACIHGRVCVCTPLLRGSGQTVHSCGGTQAKRL